MARARTKVMKLTVLLVSSAVCLLALEVAMRLLGLDTASSHSIGGFCVYDEELGWKLRPGLRRVFRTPDFSAIVEVSPQGLRDRVYAHEPEDGRRRILVIGDSVAWCWGVDMPDCFTKLMETRLPDTDVLTAGVPGYGTAQELLWYERDLRRFRPDLVVLVFVGNDPADNLDTRHRCRFELQDGRLVLNDRPLDRRKGRAKEWLMGHSKLFAQIKYALQVGGQMLRNLRENVPAPEGPAFQRELPSERDESLGITLALLERFQQSTHADGSRFAMVVFDVTPQVEREIEAFGRARRIPVLLPERLRLAEQEGRPVRFATDPHYTPTGQAILADELLAFLDAEGLLKPSWLDGESRASAQ
jgi:hypothetical protein